MSFFGRNIKKIRGVKGLSQKSFAELFDLKRATLGAYEEGRSEPKIETIIKIANYFSISIDSMLTSDLTVNELLRFKEDLTIESDLIKEKILVKIPFISEYNLENYAKYYNHPNFIEDLPIISLPVATEKKYRAIEVPNLEMTANDKGLYPKDIVIVENVSTEEKQQLGNGEVVFAVVKNEYVFRKLYYLNDNALFKAEHKNIEEKIYLKEDIEELWLAKYSFIKRLPYIGDEVEDKLLFLEKELLKLKNRG